MRKTKYIVLFIILFTVLNTTSTKASKISYPTLVRLYTEKSLVYKKLLNQHKLNQNNIELAKYSNLDQQNKLDIINYEIKKAENDYELKGLIIKNFNIIFNLYREVILAKSKLIMLEKQFEYELVLLNEIKKKYKKGLTTEKKLKQQSNNINKIQLNIEKEKANLNYLKGNLNNKLDITEKNNIYEIGQRLTGIIIDERNYKNKIHKKLLNKRYELIDLKIEKGSISNLPLKHINKLKKQKVLIRKNKKIYEANLKEINRGFKLLNLNFKKSYRVMKKRLDSAKSEKMISKKEYNLGLGTKINLLKQDLKIYSLKNEKIKMILNYYKRYLEHKSDLY